MDFDIPTDLIDRAQIGFREVAGLSSFNRNDASLPSISTLEASISSLDPSPSYLRCKFCEGKLLRGLQSLICVYCGEYQKKDLHPEPISFKSTHGYSWLLQSLNFNGSERVGSLVEGSGINGDKSPAEDELTLSELLDFKISFPDEPKMLEKNFNFKTSEQTSSLNLGTTDFDNLFTKSMSNSAIASDVTEEQPVASEADQIKIVEGQESFETDWNADFQSADIKMENTKPESVDLFKDADADLSTHMDAVFGQTQSFDFKKPDNDSDPFQDDPFANMSSATFQQNEKLESVDQAKDDYKLQNVGQDWFSDGNWQKSSDKNTLNDGFLQDNSNNTTTDWFENTNWQKDSTNNNTTTIKDDNLFDITIIQPEKSDLDNSVKHDPDVTDWFQNSQWAIDDSSSTANIVVNKDDDVNDDDDNDNDDDGFGDWNDFTSSTVNQDSRKDSWKESGNEKVDIGNNSEKMSELNLFQLGVDSKEVDFGNFLQSDLFSGDKNLNVNEAAYDDIFSEVSTSIRNQERLKNDENTPNVTASPNDDVQMLMSQMHDLSFMLKNELSVPSKPDDIGLSRG